MTSPVFAEIDTERIPLQGKYHCTYKEFGCNVILKDDDNAPVLTEYKYGKGTVYFCAYPIEDYTLKLDSEWIDRETGKIASEFIVKKNKMLFLKKV